MKMYLESHSKHQYTGHRNTAHHPRQHLIFQIPTVFTASFANANHAVRSDTACLFEFSALGCCRIQVMWEFLKLFTICE